MNTKYGYHRDWTSHSDMIIEVFSSVSNKIIAGVVSILNMSIIQVQRAVDHVHICGLTRYQQLDPLWKDLLGPDDYTRYLTDM